MVLLMKEHTDAVGALLRQLDDSQVDGAKKCARDLLKLAQSVESTKIDLASKIDLEISRFTLDGGYLVVMGSRTLSVRYPSSEINMSQVEFGPDRLSKQISASGHVFQFLDWIRTISDVLMKSDSSPSLIDLQEKISAIQEDKIKDWFDSLEGKKLVSAYLRSIRDSRRNLHA